MTDDTNAKTIFSKIVVRGIPAIIVYEDALAMAFQDVSLITDRLRLKYKC